MTSDEQRERQSAAAAALTRAARYAIDGQYEQALDKTIAALKSLSALVADTARSNQ